MSGTRALLAHGPTELSSAAFDPGEIAAGAVVRAAEALLAAGPYLVAGAVVAGVLRGMVGGPALRGAFAGRWGTARAAALGLALPLCALGALPVARELRRAGVAVGPAVAFVLCAAALNPLSLAYGLTLLAPTWLAGIVVAQLAAAVVVGALAGPGAPPSDDLPEPAPATAGRRLALAALAFAQAWLGAPAVCLLIGAVGAGVVAGVLPPGVLASPLTRENPFAPLAMALAALPAYVTPLTGMMQAGTLARDGFSPGAAWAALALGASATLGTVAWFALAHGRGVALRLLAALLGVNLALGYAAHLLLPSPVTPPDHTHALDGYTRPAAGTLAPLQARLAGADSLPLAALVAVSLVGAVLRRAGVEVRPGAPAVAVRPPASVWNRPLPARWVGLAAVGGAVVVAARLLYVLYPPPADLFEEMTEARLDLAGPMRAEDRDANLSHVRRLEELARRLPVAAVIRQGRLTPEQRARTDELTDSLDALRESVAAGRLAEAVSLLRYVKDTFDACRAAYLPTDDLLRGAAP